MTRLLAITLVALCSCRSSEKICSRTLCGTSCVDLQSSLTDCGLCGQACAAPVGGTVACVSGHCDPSCPSGWKLNGACLNYDADPANCGGFRNVCDAPAGGTATCVSGKCAGSCPAGRALCHARVSGGGTCVDRLADPHNCDVCDAVCPAPDGGSGICAGGHCDMGCPASQSVCSTPAGSFCTDRSTDTKNCGACGKTCATGELCCAGACRATSNDPTSCGCGAVACGALSDCVAGQCVCPVLTNKSPGSGSSSGYCAPDGCYALWYASKSFTETFHLATFDASSLTSVDLILRAVLDDHSTEKVPYCIAISVNKGPTTTVDLDDVPHGAPYSGPFTNFMDWTWTLPPAVQASLVSGDNSFEYTLGCAEPMSDWILLDKSQLRLFHHGC